MSGEREAYEERLALLVARAAAEREAIGKQFEPIRRIDTGLEWLARTKTQLPVIALGAGLGMSALMLALPKGRSSLLRGGLAMFQLAGSVKQLFSHTAGPTGQATASVRDPSAGAR